MKESRISHHSPNVKGILGLPYHLEMIRDPERVGVIKKAIKASVKGKPDTVFLEIGCGTGLFSLYAAQFCKKVYAVEIDDEIFKVAKRNIDNSPYGSKVELIQADGLQLDLPEKCDVIFSETLSIWMVEEPQVLIMNSVRDKFLKPGGIMLPQRVINLAEIGNVDFNTEEVIIKTSLPQFTGVLPPRIMTESKQVYAVDFRKEVPEEMAVEVEFTPLVSGLANCVRLSCIVEFASGVNFYTTDTLMPLTMVPLKEDVYLEAGRSARFRAKYKHRSNLDDSEFSVEYVDGLL